LFEISVTEPILVNLSVRRYQYSKHVWRPIHTHFCSHGLLQRLCSD